MTVDLADSNQFYIFPVSDLHYGSNWFNKEVFTQWENAFESVWDNKCIYLLGDLLEFPSTKVNAWESNLSTEDAVNHVIEMFEPYKEFVRIVASGNHEIRGKKDFNFDVTKVIAKQLGAKYTRNDFFDKIDINGSDFIVYGKHGTETSKYTDLAMKNFKINMGNVDAHLYMQGHNHYADFSQKFQRDFNGGYMKYYAFTGHFMDYKNSYAHNRGMTVSPPAFLRIGVNQDLNVSAKKFIGDCKV